MGRLLIALGCLVASIVSSAPAHAQRESPEYRRTVRNALREFNAGRWQEARALFQQAHDVYPNARTLRGIGMASFEVRDYVGAYRALLASLASDERPLTGRQRSGVTELLEQTRQLVGRFMVVVSPSAAVFEVDGSDALLEEDGYLLLSVGEHTLSATFDGHRPVRRTITVAGREDEEIRMELTALPTVPFPPPPPPRPRDDGGESAVPLVLLAAAGALAAGGAIGAVWIVDRGAEVDRCESVDPATEFCTNLHQLEGERTAALSFTIGVGALALAAAVTGTILLLSTGDGGPSEAAGAACGPSLGGMACAGWF